MLQSRLWIAFVAWVVIATTSAQAVTFEELPASPETGQYGPHVSGDGEVLVWTLSVVYRRKEGESATSIGDLSGGAVLSGATAVNYDGSVIVGNSASGWTNPEAFRWTSSGGMVGLGDLVGGDHSSALDVSDDGSTVVGYTACFPANSCMTAFVWDGVSGMEAIPVGNTRVVISGNANGPTTLGRIAGGAQPGSTLQYMSVGELTSADLAFNGTPNAASQDGSVLVGRAFINSVSQAFRWSCAGSGPCSTGSGTLEALGGIEAWDVTADGGVVAGTLNPIDGAALWDRDGNAHDLSDMLVNDYGLDLGGCRLDVATGISADGNVVVGYGDCPGIGSRVGWVVRFDSPPFPAAVPSAGPTAMFCIALMLLATGLHRAVSPP